MRAQCWTLALALALSGCFSTEALPRVKVRVTGLNTAVPTQYAGAVDLVVLLDSTGATAGDGGNAADGGTPTGAITRAIRWDGSDPMEFFVRVPVHAYGPMRVEARTTVRCHTAGHDEALDLAIAAGESTSAVSVPDEGGIDVSVGLVSVPIVCP